MRRLLVPGQLGPSPPAQPAALAMAAAAAGGGAVLPPGSGPLPPPPAISPFVMAVTASLLAPAASMLNADSALWPAAGRLVLGGALPRAAS